MACIHTRGESLSAMVNSQCTERVSVRDDTRESNYRDMRYCENSWLMESASMADTFCADLTF